MLVNFESLEDNSKIWIYQSNREFSKNEIAEIKDKMEGFIDDWLGHGDQIKASYFIKYNHFIIIAVDQFYNQVSGCSIDASVNFIKELEKSFNIDLTNKLNVSFRDGNNINIVSLADFQKFAKQHKITSKTIVFNNIISTKADLAKNWEVTADKSWHKHYLVE